MRLHEDPKMFRQAVSVTASQMGIPEIFIEKDYWVSCALKQIFKSEFADRVVFKGGTSLSKCFGMIDRFSEDIDLVVMRGDGSDAQRKRMLKAVDASVSELLPERMVEGLTRKRGMNRKTAHAYPKEFSGHSAQVRDVIVVESSWLGEHDPFETVELCSYMGDMMTKQGQGALAEQYDMLPFSVQVLCAERTFCEKLMSLIRFSHSPDAVASLKNKVRHIYDLVKMLENGAVRGFFESAAFPDLLQRVARSDVKTLRNNAEWLGYHPSEALLFRDTDIVWAQLAPVYVGEFRALVYGQLPAEAEVVAVLHEIRQRLLVLPWDVGAGT
jgi:predicted nucleotidyltransferase component of viral defense system